MCCSHTQFPKGFVFCIFQFSMPISSCPVSMPSAWCHVVWEKTRQCILSSALPWCTQRRLSPSRDASLSSTTLTVSSRAFLQLSLFSANKHKPKNALSCLVPQPYPVCPLQQLILLCTVYPSPCFIFSSPPSVLFFHSLTLCPTMLLFPSSLNHFLITSYQTFLLSPLLIPLIPFHTLSHSRCIARLSFILL